LTGLSRSPFPSARNPAFQVRSESDAVDLDTFQTVLTEGFVPIKALLDELSPASHFFQPVIPAFQVKSELDANDFETFRTLLTDFKKGSIPIEALLDGVVPLFASKDRWNLLAGFGTIIKPADRPLLQRKIEAVKRRRASMGPSEIGASHEKARDCGPQRDHNSRRAESAPSGRTLDSQIKKNGLDDDLDGSVGQPSSAGVGEGRRAPLSTGNGAYARTIVQDSVDKKSSQEVPKGRTCASCQKRPPDKAFKAACGHICCYTCWLKIVDRTKMCPTCGSRVNKAALQKLYF
jgi:hypothetical protein